MKHITYKSGPAHLASAPAAPSAPPRSGPAGPGASTDGTTLLLALACTCLLNLLALLIQDTGPRALPALLTPSIAWRSGSHSTSDARRPVAGAAGRTAGRASI